MRLKNLFWKCQIEREVREHLFHFEILFKCWAQARDSALFLLILILFLPFFRVQGPPSTHPIYPYILSPCCKHSSPVTLSATVFTSLFFVFFYTFSVFLLNTSSATGALPKWSDIALHQPNSVSSFPESLEIARLFPTSFLFADLFWFPSPKNKFSRATSISQNYGIREKPR